MTTKEILTQAVTAKNAINSADTETKNKALANMADALLAHTDAILEANKQDVEAARGKISDVMIPLNVRCWSNRGNGKGNQRAD